MSLIKTCLTHHYRFWTEHPESLVRQIAANQHLTCKIEKWWAYNPSTGECFELNRVSNVKELRKEITSERRA